MAETRTQAAAISFLGIFTLLLAALGLYALVSQVVTERTRELGIRAALGAAPGRLVRLVARSVGGAIAAGMISGLLVASLSVRIVRAFLFDTSPFDPIAWTASVVALLAVAACAVAFPARRAAGLDPANVLRE